MGLTIEKLKERSESKLIEYIKQNARTTSKGVLVWDKEPICVQDICVLSAVLVDDHIIFTDYDEATDSYPMKFMRSSGYLNYTYLDYILEYMTAVDSGNITKKSKKAKKKK